ncbi:sensor histidine kinase [Geomonas sp. Red276]
MKTSISDDDVCVEFLAAIVEHSDDAIIGKNLDGTIITWNRGAEKIFGYRADEIIGQTINRIVPPDRHGEEKEIQAAIWRGESLIQYESRRCTKDDRLIDVALTVSPIRDPQGMVFSISTIARDITVRKSNEEALLSLNEMLEREVSQRTAVIKEKDRLLLVQSRQAALGDMIRDIAHQWRQPLNIIGLLAQELSLACEMGTLSGELVLKNARKSMEQVNYLSKTIDDFRNFFKQDKEESRFKVSEALASSLSLLEKRFRDERITVRTGSVDDAVTVTGYRNEFIQVLLNIMNNAVDAFAERKTPEPLIVASVGQECEGVFVTVTDNAGGIPEEVIDRIFDPYFTTKDDHKGTGIGLFISKTIIESHFKGSLTVSNVEGGARFCIRL